MPHYIPQGHINPVLCHIRCLFPLFLIYICSILRESTIYEADSKFLHYCAH